MRYKCEKKYKTSYKLLEKVIQCELHKKLIFDQSTKFYAQTRIC